MTYPVNADESIRPESFRPEPYFPASKKEWILCDEQISEGLAILVRTSITVGEQRALNEANDDIIGPYSEEWRKMKPEERNLDEAPGVRQRRLLAPHILDWNVRVANIEGEMVEIAAPAVNGPVAFDYITEAERLWIVRVVLLGYAQTGKVDLSLGRPSDSGSTSEEEKVREIPKPKSRKPLKNSAMLSKSA